MQRTNKDNTTNEQATSDTRSKSSETVNGGTFRHERDYSNSAHSSDSARPLALVCTSHVRMGNGLHQAPEETCGNDAWRDQRPTRAIRAHCLSGDQGRHAARTLTPFPRW
jgi:hypothetical protein